MYPTDRVIYYTHVLDPSLHNSVNDYFKGKTLDNEQLSILKEYIKHWLLFDIYEFQEENNRQNLLIDLENCKSNEDIEEFLEILSDYGIDPL